VARLILLDAGPLGFAAGVPGRPLPVRCALWIASLQRQGAMIIHPEIADYEVRRELLRRGATSSIDRLNDLKRALDFREITTPAMLQAAEFWALLRRGGRPTAGPDTLDADAILAGMAIAEGQPGDHVLIAMTKVLHLARFPGIDARIWDTIS
jgi:hypothetical protein